MTIPEYLSDIDSLKTYMRRRTEGMTTKEKGDTFASLVRYVIALSSDYREFNTPELNPKSGSHDQGTDLTSTNLTDPTAKMYIQARWSIDRTDDIDSILSKFMTYSESPIGKKSPTQMSLMLPNPDTKNHYAIASLDGLHSLLGEYERQSSRPTLPFYLDLKQKHRIHVIDGKMIRDVLYSEWMRSTQRQLSTKLESVTNDGWLGLGNVHIGIISGEAIRGLYDKFGRSIFFDNIRDYLGNSYEGNDETYSVNDSIMQTIDSVPEKMLSRNNGIVIRAARVARDGKSLMLENLSIVNGCQTTMSLVKILLANSKHLFLEPKIFENRSGERHY